MTESQNLKEESSAFLTIDKYSMNRDLDDAYKSLVIPVENRIKNAIFYNAFIVFGYYYFSRNIVFFRNKKYKGVKDLSNLKILRTTVFYTFIPAILLLPNVFEDNVLYPTAVLDVPVVLVVAD